MFNSYGVSSDMETDYLRLKLRMLMDEAERLMGKADKTES